VDAHAEYTKRLSTARADLQAADRLFRSIGNARLAMMAAAFLMAWMAFVNRLFAGWWVLIPMAGFAWLAIWHEDVVERQRRASRTSRFYELGLARLEDRWAGGGAQGKRFQDPEHLYAGDVDLFGRGSLFELLSTVRMASGEATLAAWLSGRKLSREDGAPSPDAIRARQQAVAELAEDLPLREDLAVIGPPSGREMGESVHEEALATWGASPPVAFPPETTLWLYGIPSAAAIAAVTWSLEITGWHPLLWVGLAALLAARRLLGPTQQVVRAASEAARDLKALAPLLERLERQSFHAPRLQEMLTQLQTEHVPASQAIARLNTLLERREWSANMIFQIPARLLLWDEHHAVALERWRRTWGQAVGQWMAVVGEMEALCSLAAFALEHPTAVFPEFVEGAVFEGEALRHPLLPTSQAVANDVHVGRPAGSDTGPAQLWIVSGSNMSGKSTLLRCVALNAVLAWAGAPVLARRLRISPLTVGASIRVQDSLQDGRSLFYAEITRLRKILDQTKGAAPVLFLIDELLHGTNSHDRRLGSEAVLRGLIDRGAMGLVTTHDLALAGIADSLGSRALNVHFEDQLVDGAMHFDYHLRPGVVTHSNALELMRSVGLIDSPQ
jgi:hypothetical protein